MAAGFDVDLTGKTAVITGATTGLGKHIAHGLAGLGAQVVIGARDAQRGAAAQAELCARTAGAAVQVLPLDVADQASIRAFAATLADRYAAVDLLVNNAGAAFYQRRLSPDGIELTLATNVLGPHLLTGLLLDRLQAAGRVRKATSASTICRRMPGRL